MSDRSPADAGAPAPMRSRWLALALLASLSFNFLIAGVVVARSTWRPAAHPVVSVTGGSVIPRKFFRELSRERRLELLRLIRSHRAGFDAEKASIAQSMNALAAALDQPQYDEAAVAAAFDGIAGASAKVWGKGRAMAVELAGKLSEEERRLLASQIRAAPRKTRATAN